ncbi:MAG: hypothetical protein HZB16_22555 [Armatimonadetes bacterium]|nr:hypothetical protein [Armatimonadota bacterium]
MSSPQPAEHYDRRTTLVEDVINLSCIAALFLLFMARTVLPPAVSRVLMLGLLVVVAVLYVRKKLRFDRLIRRMREEQAATGHAGLPFMPGVPSRMTEPAAKPKKKAKNRR